MPLIAYNLTTSPVTLAAGNPAPTLPASSLAGARSEGYNVTSELEGLTGPNYVAIQAQVTAGTIQLEWTDIVEYETPGLTPMEESGEAPVETTAAMTLYVDPVAGLDTNPGTLVAPFKTFAKAMRATPNSIHHDVTIHLVDGVYAEPLIVNKKLNSGNLMIKGNYVLKAGEIEHTATAGRCGSYTIGTDGLTWVLDEHQDAYVKIVSGTGANQIRKIHNNTVDGTLTVGHQFSPVPNGTSAYQILIPGAKFTGTEQKLYPYAGALIQCPGGVRGMGRQMLLAGVEVAGGVTFVVGRTTLALAVVNLDQPLVVRSSIVEDSQWLGYDDGINWDMYSGSFLVKDGNCSDVATVNVDTGSTFSSSGCLVKGGAMFYGASVGLYKCKFMLGTNFPNVFMRQILFDTCLEERQCLFHSSTVDGLDSVQFFSTNCRAGMTLNNMTNTTAALWVQYGSVLTAYLLAGTGNAGVGVKVLDGSSILRDVDEFTGTLTGTGGEVKIGNMPVTTWSALGTFTELSAPARQASKAYSVSPITSATVTKIYVRSGGSDTAGTGALATPFATLAYAIQQVPLNIQRDNRYIIDITGCTETFTDTFSLPSFQGTAPYYTNPAPDWTGWAGTYPLTIQAVPTTLDTLTSATSSPDAVTGNYSYTQVGKTWTVNQFQGKMVVGGNYTACIASNTADTIEVCCPWEMTGTLTIFEPSATLTTSSSSYNALYVTPGTNCGIVFRGLNILNPGTNYYNVAINMQNPIGYIGFVSCRLDGMYMFGAGLRTVIDSCYFDTKSLSIDAFNVMLRFSYLKSLADSLTLKGTNFFTTGDIFDGCKTIGDLDGQEMTSWDMEKSEIRNCTGNGIELRSGCKQIMYKLKIGCTGNGIYAIGPQRVEATQIGGSVGGIGLVAEDGAHIKTNSACNITGSGGDLKSGGLVATDWTTFRGGAKNQLDTTTDLSRIWEP